MIDKQTMIEALLNRKAISTAAAIGLTELDTEDIRRIYEKHVPEEDRYEDDDPVCVCGVHRSEHKLCGCGEGFQRKLEWEKERRFIQSLSDEEYDRIYHPEYAY